MFIVDGVINWYFWGNWVLLIGTILLTLFATAILGSERNTLTESVLSGILIGAFGFVILLIGVTLIALVPKLIVAIIAIAAVLYFVAWIGQKIL